MIGRIVVSAAALAGPVVVLAGPVAGQDAPRPGELRLATCEDPGIQQPAKCGTFTVWENRDAREGRTLDLKVVVIEASGDDPEGAPLVYLSGGPGSAATAAAAGISRSPLRRGRDILLVDQRGTGGSNGLFCGPERTAPLQAFMATMDIERVQACRAELEERADLRHYLTTYAMDDLDDLRAALGYDRLNLQGASYGTRAALVYIRRHGEHVRAALLLGSTAMTHPMPGGFARGAEAALDAVLEDCGAEPACAEAFPALRDDYRAAVRTIEDEGPLTVTVGDPRNDDSVEVRFGATDFAESLRAMLYSPEPARRIPLFLHHAATTGDYRPFAEFQLGRNLGLREELAEGMYFAVTCTEDVARSDTAAVYAAGQGTFLADHRARPHIEGCRGWPLGRLAEGYGGEVESDVPVLIVTGENDPATPPSAAHAAASRLTNARVVIVPFGGHGMGGLDGVGACMGPLLSAFLDTADPGSLDTSCLERVRRQPFILELDDAG